MAHTLHSPAGRRDGQLWAVSCYFNPADSRRRLDNYHAFRRHLTVPLVTVELSFHGVSQLTEEDADILVTLNSPDILWQKERLLNIALSHLPDHCDTVAWLDGDIVFERDDWPQQARRQLKEHALVQLFSTRLHLSPHSSLEDPCSGPFEEREDAIAFRLSGDSGGNTLSPESGAQRKRPVVPGTAWSCRRKMLDEHKLYDACILGGGDRALLSAALGDFDAADRLRLSERHREHYLEWARPFFKAVQGRIGYVEGKLFHLWHGTKKNRRYRQRHEVLNAFSFDPSKDIVLDSAGCWCWGSDKEALHKSVNHYFKLRNDDEIPPLPDESP